MIPFYAKSEDSLTYPYKTVLNQDTVFVLDRTSMEQVAKQGETVTTLQKKYAVLLEINTNLNVQISKYEKDISLLEKQTKKDSLFIDSQALLINSQRSTILSIDEKYKDILKISKQKNFRNIMTFTSIGIGVGTTLGLILGIIIN